MDRPGGGGARSGIVDFSFTFVFGFLFLVSVRGDLVVSVYIGVYGYRLPRTETAVHESSRFDVLFGPAFLLRRHRQFVIESVGNRVWWG